MNWLDHAQFLFLGLVCLVNACHITTLNIRIKALEKHHEPPAPEGWEYPFLP